MNKFKIATVSVSIGLLALFLILPQISKASLTVGSTSVVSDGALTLNGAAGSNVLFGTTATTGNISMGTALTTGTVTIGGTTQTGTITIGNSTGSQSVYIAGGSQASGSRNVYIANFTSAGSNTISIGSDISGTQSTINIGNYNSGRSVNQQINIGRADLADGKTNEICIACVANFGANYTDITIGNYDANASVYIRGGSSINISGNTTGAITIGHGSGAGTILLGPSTASNTISIGSATTGAGNTQTINIGSSATGTGKATIIIGNATTSNASSVAIRSGKNTGGGILLEGGLNFGISFDGDDDYDITISPAPSFPSSPATGMVIIFQVLSANIGAATININGNGAIPLVKGNDAALATNDIIAGRTYIAVFDGSNFDLINPATQ